MTTVVDRMPDQHGVLLAYELDGNGGGRELDREAGLAPEGAGFRWLHLQSDTPASEEWMSALGLDEKVIEVLAAHETRPRCLSVGGGVLIVLRGVNTNPGADPEDMVSIRIWFTESAVVSARLKGRRLLSVEDVRLQIESRQGPTSTGEFIDRLVERMADRIGDVVDGIEEELTGFEERLAGDEDMKVVRRSLSDSRRQTAAIRRYLAPQRDALDALYRTKGVLNDDTAYALRAHTDRMTRYIEDLDLVRERMLVLQEELYNRMAEQQNARLYILSLVAAVFLPLSFLTGVFGMNVAGLPGTANPQAFFYLSVGMSVLAVVMVLLFWMKRWL